MTERDTDPTIEDVPDTGEDDEEPEPTDDPIPETSQ